jgi:hypothetical protein
MTIPPPDAATKARNRYFVMAGARLSGALFGVIGCVLIGRATIDAQRWIGVAVVVLGLFEMALLPRLLAQRWRTPAE